MYFCSEYEVRLYLTEFIYVGGTSPLDMENERSQSTSITIEISPPKYQATIDKQARQALGVEGQKSILQADLILKRTVDEGGDS